MKEAGNRRVKDFNRQILAGLGLAEEERAVLVRLTDAPIRRDANIAASEQKAFVDA